MTEIHNQEDADLVRGAVSGALGPLILELWQKTRIDWSFATDRLSHAFRQNRGLASRERRFVAETLYGLIRQLRRLDAALEAGGLVAVGAAPDRQRLLAYLVLDGQLEAAAAAREEPDIDWEAVAGIDERIERLSSPVERLARRRSLPDWLAAALVSEYGGDADALAAALNERAPMTIRANTLRTSRDELAERLRAGGIDTTPGRHAQSALIAGTRTNLFGLAEFREGLFEAQDEGSQLIAELVAPPPRSLVVDYCAGAGGKTLALAATLENKGRLLACDVDKRKLAELRRRAARAGVDNVQAVSLDGAADAATPRALEPCLGHTKRVLVDAPCTGIGALRRNPEARWRLTPADLRRLPVQQTAIAERALELLNPGGRLIYATCTILEAENQAVVASLCDGRSDLEILSPSEIWGRERAEPVLDSSGRFLKTLPHVHGCDGFFAAVIRRRRG